MAGGRPRRLKDPAIREVILNALKLGLSRGTAAKVAGVHTSTIANEAARDKGFLEALKKAEGLCEQTLVAIIYSAAKDPKRWTAAAWLLERKFRKRWARDPKPKEMSATSYDDTEETPSLG